MHPKSDSPHSWKPRDFFIFGKMREHQALKIRHFSIFKVNFQGQKSIESFWKWFSFVNMLIVEQLLLLIFCNFWVLYFVKMCPIFDGSLPTDLEIYEKLLRSHQYGPNFGCLSSLCFTLNYYNLCSKIIKYFLFEKL